MLNFPIPKKQNDFLSSTYNIKDVKIRPFIKQDFSIKPYKIVPMKRIPMVPTFQQKNIHVKEQNNFTPIPEQKANNDFNNKIQGIPKHQIPNEDNVLYHEYKLKGLNSSDFVISKLQEEAGTANQITTSNRMKETGESKEEAVKGFMELYATKKGLDVGKTSLKYGTIARPPDTTSKTKLNIEKVVKDDEADVVPLRKQEMLSREDEFKDAKDGENDDEDVEKYEAHFRDFRKGVVDEYNERKTTENDEDFMTYFKGLTNEQLQFILSGVYNVDYEEYKKFKKADLVKKIMDLDENRKGVKGLIDYYEKLSTKKTGRKSVSIAMEDLGEDTDKESLLSVQQIRKK